MTLQLMSDTAFVFACVFINFVVLQCAEMFVLLVLSVCILIVKLIFR